MLKLTVYILFVLTATTFSQVDSVVTYFSNGNIKSIIYYKDNVRDGEAKFFNENGNVKQELSYFNGKVNGTVSNYDENGKLRKMFSIVDGKRDGSTSYFDSAGIYTNDVFYTEGRLDIDEKPLTHSKFDGVLSGNEPGDKKNLKTEKEIKPDQLLPPVVKKERDLEEDPAFYLSVEVMPEPIGGMKAIYKKLHYPAAAIKNNIEGTVLIRVFIDRDGEVLDANVLKGIGYGCDESARIAVFYHRFKPGLQKGQRVKIQMDIPIEFKLKKINPLLE
jgi:TonB family protein